MLSVIEESLTENPLSLRPSRVVRKLFISYFVTVFFISFRKSDAEMVRLMVYLDFLTEEEFSLPSTINDSLDMENYKRPSGKRPTLLHISVLMA